MKKKKLAPDELLEIFYKGEEIKTSDVKKLFSHIMYLETELEKSVKIEDLAEKGVGYVITLLNSSGEEVKSKITELEEKIGNSKVFKAFSKFAKDLTHEE